MNMKKFVSPDGLPEEDHRPFKGVHISNDFLNIIADTIEHGYDGLDYYDAFGYVDDVGSAIIIHYRGFPDGEYSVNITSRLGAAESEILFEKILSDMMRLR